MKNLYTIVDILILVGNWTWGIIMNIVGTLAWVVHESRGGRTYYDRKHKLIILEDTSNTTNGTCCLGMFIIINSKDKYKNIVGYDLKLIKHEKGHSIQNAILGPLFIIIGLCSVIWCNAVRPLVGGDYYRFFTEKWANELAIKYYGTT